MLPSKTEEILYLSFNQNQGDLYFKILIIISYFKKNYLYAEPLVVLKYTKHRPLKKHILKVKKITKLDN